MATVPVPVPVPEATTLSHVAVATIAAKRRSAGQFGPGGHNRGVGSQCSWMPRSATLGTWLGEVVIAEPAAAPAELPIATPAERVALLAAMRRMDADARGGEAVRRIATAFSGLLDGPTAVARLFDAIERERLVVHRVPAPALPRPQAPAIVDLKDLAAPELPANDPPPPVAEKFETWFQVTLLDEIGKPLSGVKLRFTHEGAPVEATTNG